MAGIRYSTDERSGDRVAAAAPAAIRSAIRVDVYGVVQGVGFRPFVHRLAVRHHLAGWIRNEAGGVAIVVEGDQPDVRQFLDHLVPDAPPLARIESLETRPVVPEHLTDFTIIASVDQANRRQPVSPDVALCAACEAELVDPANRRYRYPFITCTDCGPRFTVIETMPYDRERTSMRAFTQCVTCRQEYESPLDRRYHSETNSCPECGPQVTLIEPATDHRAVGQAAIEAAAKLLVLGNILAVRGLGGFHLAVDATNDAAVQRLRERKHRDAKPLAVMVRGLDEARQLGRVGHVEAELLSGPERPIVLLPRRADARLAPSIAPGLDTVGVMTAYTPLHHLLLAAAGCPLVMTSGNLSEEPIATSNEDARQRLGRIADAFLVHDREIVARYDDSVVRVVGDAPVVLRRARGYAPLPLDLPIGTPEPIVAVGPHLKNTFALVHDRTVYVSQHIGDLENLETLDHFHAVLDAYRRLFRVDPAVVARDMHPGYLSTNLAEDMDLERVIAVQHHHAHLAAVAAEHGLTKPVIGLAFDGTGYGEDGHVWGAEVLTGDLTGYERRAHLRYAALPGGDLAVRNPWRVALGYAALAPDAADAFSRAFEGVDPRERGLAERQIAASLNAPLASSMGRLFDAAAAILGVRRTARYEGQAAMELEALAGKRAATPLPLPLIDGDGGLELDPIPLLVALGERATAGDDIAELAARFHDSVAAASAATTARVREQTGLTIVVLGGGVFQNARLLSTTIHALTEFGFDVRLPRRLSPNDGAISYGQAAVAAALLAREKGV